MLLCMHEYIILAVPSNIVLVFLPVHNIVLVLIHVPLDFLTILWTVETATLRLCAILSKVNP